MSAAIIEDNNVSKAMSELGRVRFRCQGARVLYGGIAVVMVATIDFSTLANPSMRNLQAYDPGHDIPGLRMRSAGFGGLCELGSNENCYGPSANVYPALAREMQSLHRYPDPSGKNLKSALSRNP